MKKYEVLKVKEFAIVIALAMLVIHLLYDKNLFMIVAVVILAIGIVLPILLFPFAYIWFKLGYALGRIASPIILTLIYIIILLPVSLARSIKGIDTLKIKFKKYRQQKTSFFNRIHLYESKDLKHTF